MGRNDALTKSLVLTGLLLIAAPLVMPVLAWLPRVVGRPDGVPANFDYLMPFELFPFTLLGIALLVWGARRARLRRRGIWISLGIVGGGFVAASVSAQATGIANSEQTLEAWRYILTASLGAVSLIGEGALVVLGIMLLTDLFRASRREHTAEPA